MKPEKYAITFACYNQVEYTKKCIASMIAHGVDLSRLAIVDNASSDETRAYLETLPLGALILNQDNLGCGVAWNQGALALQAEWTIVMNNDVLVSANWIENLIETAEKHNLKVISPALIEGELDYDFEAFSAEASSKMKDALRLGGRHAVCMAIHRSVWMDVGYFQPVPKLLGYEDTLFFHEVAKAGIAVGMTGASWLHHYGSMTLSLLKQERGLSQKAGLGSRYNYKLLNQSWLARKIGKLKRKKQLKAWKEAELQQYGMTMHGVREHGDFVWVANI
ncbi:glycosyltransferase family 2 protein [Chitinibacter sp. S2-10]|uniref:glycosyltransferase family 2 protein n=1 Tax=Chitinibacter sp. S2-10 TaxID=3373597 RepID=UPI003977D7D5